MSKPPSIVNVACALDILRRRACEVYESRLLGSARNHGRLKSCEMLIRKDYDRTQKALQIVELYFGIDK